MASRTFPWSSIVVLSLLCFVVGVVSGMLFAERDSVDISVIGGTASLALVTLVYFWDRTRRAAHTFQAEFAEDVEHFARRQLERERTIGHA